MTLPLLRFSMLALVTALALAAQAPAERTIRENRVTTGNKDDQTREAGVSGQALESVLSSGENLNLIRDGFLRRLSGDGCPPDVAARVAELRVQLHEGEVRHGAAGAGDKGAPRSAQSSAEFESAMYVLASTWYAKRGVDTPAATARTSDAERARLLEYVLSPGDSKAAAQSADAAQMRTELDRLLAGCRPAR